MVGLRPLQGNLRLVFRLFSLMRGKASFQIIYRIRLNNLKTSLRFPCLGLIDPIKEGLEYWGGGGGQGLEYWGGGGAKFPAGT